MSRFTILLNGPVIVTDRLLQLAVGTRAIAADGGMAHAVPLGLDVELWIGDFDSTSETLAARHRDIPCERFSAAKDKTDGELAAEEEAYPVLPGSMRPALPLGSRMSIIALADLSGLTLRGAHWPLRDAEISLGSTWTLSNIVTGSIEIELASGYGILIAYPHGASETA